MNRSNCPNGPFDIRRLHAGQDFELRDRWLLEVGLPRDRGELAYERGEQPVASLPMTS
jgi:hypothetical protein